MPLKPLEVLKRGVKAKKEKLQAQLHVKKPMLRITRGAAKDLMHDETQTASEGVVRRLREVAGDLSKVVGKKWKSQGKVHEHSLCIIFK